MNFFLDVEFSSSLWISDLSTCVTSRGPESILLFYIKNMVVYIKDVPLRGGVSY